MQSYIENKGITKTIINNHGKKDENEIKWKANYDGEKADIKMKFSKNCNKNKMHIQLNNTDLASILGVKPIPIPLEKRLASDFLTSENESDEYESEDEYETQPIIMHSTSDRPNTSSLEEELSRLLHIRPFTPKSQQKGEPILFRVTPQVSKTDFEPKSKKSSSPEVLTVSEMLFDPAFDLSAPPITLREPTHIEVPSGIPTLTPDSLALPSSILEEFAPKKRAHKRGSKKALKKILKRGKKSVRLLYKTPKPKTYRIHLTSNKSSNRSSSNKNSKKLRL
jgi:hypothetical protein